MFIILLGNSLIILLFHFIISCQGNPKTETASYEFANIAKAEVLCKAKRLVWDFTDGTFNFLARANSYYEIAGDLEDYVLTGGDTCFIF